MKRLSIGFIGLGLIGGSIAKAIKLVHPEYELIAYDHQASNKLNPTDLHIKTNLINEDISMAMESKVIDYVIHDLTFFSPCDIIFLCAPVLHNLNYLKELKDIISDSVIVTDVGSVKSNIHDIVSSFGLSTNFIGGHPMTGSEKTGFYYSSPTILENAYYILTPTKETPISMVEDFTQLVKDIHAIPIQLGYEEHDKITAAISHLPHIIASSLVNLIEESDDNEEHMRYLAAGGFKDITRIASASPTIWQNICLTNTDSILYYLDQYIASLQDVKLQLENNLDKELYDFFDKAKEYRNSIPKESKGLGIPIYEIYVDILDVTGAIASLATKLSNNSINIKNIGIIHNREFEEGVLRIEFYNEHERESATCLLRNYDYNIYKR